MEGFCVSKCDRLCRKIVLLLLMIRLRMRQRAELHVTFDLNGGELVQAKPFSDREQGPPPAPDATNGRMELSWDKEFANVTGDMTVTAQWCKVAMSSPDLPNTCWNAPSP